MPIEGRMSVYVQGTENSREVKSEVFKRIQQGMNNNDFVNVHECLSKLVFVGVENEVGDGSRGSSAAPKKSLTSFVRAGYITVAVIFGVVVIFASFLFVKMNPIKTQRRNRGQRKEDLGVDYDDGTLSSFDEFGIADRDLFNILGVERDSVLYDPSTDSSAPSAETTEDVETVVASNTARHARKMRRRKAKEETLNHFVDVDLGTDYPVAEKSGRLDDSDDEEEDKYGSFDFFDLILENKPMPPRPTGSPYSCRTGQSDMSDISF